MSYTEEALAALDELEATLAGGCAVSVIREELDRFSGALAAVQQTSEQIRKASEEKTLLLRRVHAMLEGKADAEGVDSVGGGFGGGCFRAFERRQLDVADARTF